MTQAELKAKIMKGVGAFCVYFFAQNKVSRYFSQSINDYSVLKVEKDSCKNNAVRHKIHKVLVLLPPKTKTRLWLFQPCTQGKLRFFSSTVLV